MTKREAKREACFRAALVLENSMGAGWETEFGEEDEEKLFSAMRELVAELHRRGWKVDSEKGT